MPEGHTVHRTANDFNKLFAATVVKIDSPQGRFSADAKKINGHTLKRARAIGKQLFLEFDNELTLRIHLGIYGKWKFYDTKHAPDVVGEVRARFQNSTTVAELRGPTVCEVLEQSEIALVEQRLGPDPLNPDRDSKQRDRFVSKVLNSKSSIGLLMMNQAVISGIGNVYRAEILFRANINPHTPGCKLTREQVEAIWADSVELLKVGVKTGYMITRDELRTQRPSKAERNFVYKREGLPCRICGTNILIELLAARKLYWCPSCQS